MQQELDLFRFRFLRENADSRDDFLRENNLNYEPISDNVKMELTSELRAAAGSKAGVIEIYEYFKVSICSSSYIFVPCFIHENGDIRFIEIYFSSKKKFTSSIVDCREMFTKASFY